MSVAYSYNQSETLKRLNLKERRLVTCSWNSERVELLLSMDHNGNIHAHSGTILGFDDELTGDELDSLNSTFLRHAWGCF